MKKMINMMTILLLTVGCTGNIKPIKKPIRSDKIVPIPRNIAKKESKRVNNVTRIQRKEPYTPTYRNITNNRFYSCLSNDGSRSMPCMIKRAKRGLYEFNERIIELNRALGDCEDCR